MVIFLSDHSDDQFPRGLKSDSLVSGVTVSGVCEEFTRKIQVKDRFLCSFFLQLFVLSHSEDPG